MRGFVAVSGLVLAILALVGSPAGAQVRRTITVEGRARAYRLFVPPGVRAPAPLLLLFHGSGRDAKSIVDPWKDFASKQGVILAALEAADPNVWRMPADGPMLLRDLVDAIKAVSPVDERRMYLFGHSGGAVHALNIAMLESEYFAAVAVHAGAWRDEADLKLPNYSTRPIPVTIVIGDRDPLFPLDAVNATSAAIKANGNPADVVVIKGHDHDYYKISGNVNTLAWDALKKVALPGPARFREYQTK